MYFVKTIEVYLLLKIGFDLHNVLSLAGHPVEFQKKDVLTYTTQIVFYKKVFTKWRFT